MTRRVSDSFLLPLRKAAGERGGYDLYPAFEAAGPVYEGLKEMAEALSGERAIVLDGNEGVFWDELIPRLVKEFPGRRVRAIPVLSAMKTPAEIDSLIEPFMGEEDSIFGRKTTLRLIDFFDRTALAALHPDPSADITILYGPGAFLAGWTDSCVYVDLPKNELQARMAAGAAFNLGADRKFDGRISYKRCYFVDWPVLDSYKADLVPSISWMVDEQRIDRYTVFSGDTFRNTMDAMCRDSFRVRPWFASGVWGGTWLRDNVEGTDASVENLAWSYELMALENGVLIQSGGLLAEFSFAFLMAWGTKEILGKDSGSFGREFPIRFDFLDTVGGGNLSIQCHPRPEYIRSRFGEAFTQDETYYIVEAGEDAAVYLGFQEGIDREAFVKALRRSQEKAEKLEITDYVQKHPAAKGDLFLIPNGTIHASGAGNLVLEISSAPYIFTFKMYDWVRLDRDGRPRPINIEHGLNNVRFERKGDIVKETLICHPETVSQTPLCTMEHLPTHPDHFYDVLRYRISPGGRKEVECNGKCHVLMVVEGQSAVVAAGEGKEKTYNRLETVIIPSAAGGYTVENRSCGEIVVVDAFVKNSYML